MERKWASPTLRRPSPRHRRVSETLLVGAATVVTIVATVLLVVGLLPVGDAGAGGAERGPVPPLPIERVAELTTFEQPLLAEIAAYRTPRRAVALAAFMVAVVVPALLAAGFATGRARRLLRTVGRSPGPAVQVGAATASVVLLTTLVRFPLSAWAGIVQDGRYGFRTASGLGWLLDHLLVVGGRALGVGFVAWMVVRIVLRRPSDWPARVTLLVAVVGPLALLLHPLVAHPLLLPTTTLPDGEHREAVLAVLARSERDVTVLVGEASRRTTRRNAVATGLGPTERIVLHDTLLDLDPREVAAITAHELAHLERRDPLRAALAPVPAVALLSLLVQRRLRRWRRPDVRILAAVAALVLAIEAAATPLAAGLTRTVELRTDVRSVALSADPEAHLRLLRTFVVDGLADPDPPRWSVLLWATHPTPSERMRAVSGVGDPATR